MIAGDRLGHTGRGVGAGLRLDLRARGSIQERAEDRADLLDAGPEESDGGGHVVAEPA